MRRAVATTLNQFADNHRSDEATDGSVTGDDPTPRLADPQSAPSARPLRIAAVQTPAAESVRAGLERAAPLVRAAAADGADLVLLPELMAVRYVFTEEMWDSAEPSHGPTVEWLRDTALSLRIWLGTSFLEADGEDFYNTFV